MDDGFERRCSLGLGFVHAWSRLMNLCRIFGVLGWEWFRRKCSGFYVGSIIESRFEYIPISFYFVRSRHFLDTPFSAVIERENSMYPKHA